MQTLTRWRSIYRLILGSSLGLGLLAAFPIAAQEVPPPPVAVDSDEVETLTRGPIHEAFASPTTTPEEPLVIPKQPPEAIDEVPPSYRPEGDDVIWIPGYWAWDDERSDFLWISGVWRERPPGQRWVPGYWAEVGGGFQWVAGFWISAETTELSYQPAPPASLEEGPSSPSPGDEYFWVPGNWDYHDTGYRWQAGYWTPYQPDWVWVPSCYYYTPIGCVFTRGFWDYRFSRRGQLFAPVYFQTAVYRRPNYFYTPSVAINAGNLFVNLWVRPNYCHYYFGDYYGQHYSRWNMTPWYQIGVSRRYYDPLWAYSRCHFGLRGIDYAERMQGWHNYYVRHEDHRPPRTYRDQLRLVQRNETNINVNQTVINQNIIAADFRQIVNREGAADRFRRIDDDQRERFVSLSREIRDLHRDRRQVERTRDAVARRDDGKTDGKAGPGRDDKGRDRRELPKLKLPQHISDVARDAGNEANRRRTRPEVPPIPDTRTARDGVGREAKGRENGGRDLAGPDNAIRNGSPADAGKGKVRPGRDLDLPGRLGDTARDDADKSRDRPDREKTGPGKAKLPDTAGPVNDERGPTLEQRLQEARERAAQAGKSGDRPDGIGATRPGANATPGAKTGTRPSLPDLNEELPDAAPGASDTPRPGRPGRDDLPKGDNTPRRGTPGLDLPNRLPRTDVPSRPNLPGRPDVDLPRSAPGDLPKAEPRTPRLPTRDLPKLDRPNRPSPSTPRLDASPGDRGKSGIPRLETPRTETRRPEIPRADVPRPGIPRLETPTPSTPRLNVPRPDPRPNVPGLDTSRLRPEATRTRPEIPSSPRLNTPRPDTPRLNLPSSRPNLPSSRPNIPSTNSPRTESRRIELPSAAAPRSIPRPQPRISQPQPRISQPRIDSPRGGTPSRPSLPSRPGGENDRGRGRSNDR